MASSMDVDPSGESRIALHPLTIVHMSDQYTRISCGGSPLDKNAPVVGLLFGNTDDDGVLQIRDADEIDTKISESTTVQVNLHTAVFPQHSVVGWYRVSQEDEAPTASDTQITQSLKGHYAPETGFHFCLLKVENPNRKPAAVSEGTEKQELPINLYELQSSDGGGEILQPSTNWELETADPERIAVEHVMKEKPAQVNANAYVSETQSLQQSLVSLKDRVEVLIRFIEDIQKGSIPTNHSLLRQVQALLYSLGPLSALVAPEDPAPKAAQDAELLSHLAAVAKTVSAVQSYTDKFRIMHENKVMNEKVRRMF